MWRIHFRMPDVPLFLVCLLPCLAGAEPAPFELKDGDRVLFVGNTFLERDRHYGTIETMLRSRFPGRTWTLRNLAWPGDTTMVQLRPLNFGSPQEHIAAHRPTVVFVSYGMNEAF